MEVNKIYNENCLDTMRRMPDNFIDCIVTSPPYWNLRDYGKEEQVGIEDSFKDYLSNLDEIFTEAKRVLKEGGVCWVNLGDTYQSKTVGNIRRKSLVGIPDRFKINMIDAGWLCRNEIIWHKPNAIPSSGKDRFIVDFEKFFMFTKNERYYFETQYEERITKAVKTKKKTSNEDKYESVEQESSVRQGMNKTRGQKLIEKRNHLPTQEYFIDFLRSTTTKSALDKISNIKTSTIEHWFRKDESGFSYPKPDDWSKVRDYLNNNSKEFKEIDYGLKTIDYETDDINKNAHKGRIKRSVWSINTKPNKEAHFATYPEELIITPILSSCPENGIVYDPFMGSGTTAKIAKDNNRKYIGSEISEDYCEIAEKRIKT